jgi:hypothetical protein
MAENNPVADWFKQKKEQLLRRQGAHLVPSSTPKVTKQPEKVEKRKEIVKNKKKIQTRGDLILSLTKHGKKKEVNKDMELEEEEVVVDPVNADMEEKEEETFVSDPVNVASINSWMEAAEAAGVQFVQYADEVVVDDDIKSVETVGEIIGDNKKDKRKTPKQSRTEVAKIMAETKVSESNKKTFKEAFNTDKSRMEKRQTKYSRPQNFLIIMEDNINSAACTSGKLMVYGKGAVSDKFFSQGLKFNNTDYFVHKNTHNFEQDIEVKKKAVEEEEEGEEEEGEEELGQEDTNLVVPGPSKRKSLVTNYRNDLLPNMTCILLLPKTLIPQTVNSSIQNNIVCQ